MIPPYKTIAAVLNAAIDEAVRNGANSKSMPDELVEIAAWLNTDPDKADSIYLSGPMSGIAEHNYPAFHAAAASLRAQGHKVVNPAEINAVDKEYMDCLRMDFMLISTKCQGISLMPGWQHSYGARAELDLCKSLKLGVIALPGAENPK